MTKEKDYRNSDYCPALSNVQQKKQVLEEEIKKESAKTRIFYNKISDRKGRYHQKFADIYKKMRLLWNPVGIVSGRVL